MNFRAVLTFVLLSLASGQDGQYADNYDNGDDNLYADYANKQQMKLDGGGNGGGFRNAAFVAGGFAVAKMHGRGAMKRLKKKHAKEQKNLYTQYYNDVYKMQETVNEYVEMR